jgi:hypothetical protein
MVTQFFEKAATRGHALRQDEERDESQAPSAGKQGSQREERRPGGMSAEDRAREKAGRKRHNERQAQSGAAKPAAEE